MTIKHQVQGRANKRRGDAVEKRVARLLADMGYVMIERVHTPFTLIRRGKKIVGAFPRERVSGDFRAVATGVIHNPTVTDGGSVIVAPSLKGLSVLVEVKSRPDRLQWSALEKHQVEALNEHAQYSEHTWLFFHDSETDTITKYRWPIHGYGPGKSLKP